MNCLSRYLTTIALRTIEDFIGSNENPLSHNAEGANTFISIFSIQTKNTYDPWPPFLLHLLVDIEIWRPTLSQS